MSIKKRFTWVLIIFFAHILGIEAQRIIPDEKVLNYSCEDKTLREILFELSEISNVSIAFQEQILPGDSILSFSVRDERLGKILDYMIEDHGLRYKVVGNQIAIVKDKFRKAEQKITISGYLKDAESGEALVNAHVYLYDKSEVTVSNEYGFYSFTIPKGVQRVYYSYLGYDLGIKELSLKNDTIFDIELAPSHLLKEIIITETKLTPIPLNEPDVATVDVIPIGTINSKLPLGGEPDVMRVALTQSGVTSGSDGFGGMSVRGGGTNQNLILFDGIPVYNPSHVFGLFSIFNAKVIKSAKLYKGAFPSHYSGRLSSVMDIRTREGNYRKFSGDVTVGLLTASAAFEGPIVKDRSSFLISARRTFVDPWIGTVSEALNRNIGKEGRMDFYFYDINAKLNFSIGKNSKAYFSYYTGNDFFENDVLATTESNNITVQDRDQVNWNNGNTLASFRWNTRVSQKTFLNITAYQSKYNFDSFDHDRIERRRNMTFLDATYDAGYYQSQIEDLGGRIEFDYMPNARHRIKIGAGYIDHDFRPGLLLVNQSDSIKSIQESVTSQDLQNSLDDNTLAGTELEVYFEDNIKLGKRSKLNLGYNHMIVNTGEQSYSIPQPRILFSTGSEKHTFKSSIGRMGQYLHSLTNTGLGVPIDVWLPSTDKIEPEISWIASLGNYFETKSLGTLGVEFFYKTLSNVTRYGEEGLVDITSDSNWEELIAVGNGESYGAEFSLNKSKGRTKYNLNYTLSWSNRQFDELNRGEAFRFRYDRRHVLNVGIVHTLNANMDISVNWEFGSGTPITVPSGARYLEFNEQSGNEIVVLVYSALNNDNLPDYHRLDFGFNIKNEYTWGKTQLTLGLYNAYNRLNPFYRDIVVDLENGNSQVRYEDVTILPVLPTLSYNINF